MQDLDQLSPVELLRRLRELEGTEGPDEAYASDQLQFLNAKLAELPTVDIFELIHISRHLEEDVGCRACIWALRERVEPATFHKCAAWAESPEPERREAAADILGQLGYSQDYPFAQQSVPIIERLLADSDEEVLASALAACHYLGILDASVLVPFAAHSDQSVRFAAMQALTGRSDPVSTGGLIALTRDSDNDVRNWATFGLGQMTDADNPDIREALLARVGDDDPEIRGEALVGLAKRGDRRALTPLAKELAGEFHGVWSVEAAAAFKDPSLASLLVELKQRLGDDELERFGSEVDDAIAACTIA